MDPSTAERTDIRHGEVKLAIDHAVSEYLASAEVEEVIRRLNAVTGDANGVDAAKLIVYRAMDAKASKREMLAGLLSSLHVRGVINHGDVEAAISICLTRASDMKLDQPRLEEKMSSLLVYLIQDDTISEGFLDRIEGVTRQPDNTDDASNISIISDIRAQALDSLESRTPTALLQTRTMYKEIVKVYLKHGEMDRFNASIAAMNAQYTLHEVVRRAVLLSIHSSDFQREAASDLMHQLHSNGTLTTGMVEEGFLRLLRAVGEMAIDDPGAPAMLGRFVARACADGIVRSTFVAHAASVAEVMYAAGTPLPAPMNLLARKSAERSVDGWLSVDDRELHGSGAASVPAALSGAVREVLATASSILGDVTALTEVSRARIRSIWGFRRPLSELRQAIEDMVKSYLSAPAEGGAVLLEQVASFECSEILPDLVSTLIQQASAHPAVTEALQTDLNAMSQRRFVKQRYLIRGLVQALEALLRTKGEQAAALQDTFMSVLVYLARTGCVPSSFFIDVMPQVEEDCGDDGSESSLGRVSLDELRVTFARELK